MKIQGKLRDTLAVAEAFPHSALILVHNQHLIVLAGHAPHLHFGLRIVGSFSHQSLTIFQLD